MGLPVVATDVRGCREVVDPGVTGSLVPVRDPRALADALRGLENPATRATQGAAARARAEREFDEQRVVETVLETYREVAKRKGLYLRGL